MSDTTITWPPTIILASIEPKLIEAWTVACGDLSFVSVTRRSILDVSCDAAVCPTNSFGFLTGGTGFGFAARFGEHLQPRLQSAIRQKHHGELLVGAAEIIATEH